MLRSRASQKDLPSEKAMASHLTEQAEMARMQEQAEMAKMRQKIADLERELAVESRCTNMYYALLKDSQADLKVSRALRRDMLAGCSLQPVRR